MRREAWLAALACGLAAPLFAPLLGVSVPAWLALVLAAPVQFVFGARCYVGAWNALRARRGNMDLLVALGTSGAFGFSVYVLLTGSAGAPVYFDISAAVIALVVLGDWLETRVGSTIERVARDSMRHSLVESVPSHRAAGRRLVDRVCAGFLPYPLLITLGALAGWWLIAGDATAGVLTALGVMALACPGAVGLVTPVTLLVGTRVAARAGLFIRDAESLELAYRLDTVIFTRAAAVTEGYGAIERLHALGVHTVLMSADDEPSVTSHATRLATHRVVANAPPARQVSEIRGLQAQGRWVAVIGDKVSDAQALIAADLGFTTGSVAAVADVIALSRATHEKIRQGLFWTFVYNVIGLPAAGLGMLSPLVAAGTIAFSTVSVVLNAQRLRSWKPSASSGQRS